MTKPTGARRGRASIFRDKEHGVRVQGVITVRGAVGLERARRELRQLYREVVGRPPITISDADVIEFLARGAHDTRVYLEREHWP